MQNNPVNYVDPDGQAAQAIRGAYVVGGAVGRRYVAPGINAVVRYATGGRSLSLGDYIYDVLNPTQYDPNVYSDSGEDEGESCPPTEDSKPSTQRGNPYNGEPNTWSEHPHGKQDRLYGPDGTPAVDIDFGHDHGQGSPHSHNWEDGKRGVGVPVSVIPGTRSK